MYRRRKKRTRTRPCSICLRRIRRTAYKRHMLHSHGRRWSRLKGRWIKPPTRADLVRRKKRVGAAKKMWRRHRRPRVHWVAHARRHSKYPCDICGKIAACYVDGHTLASPRKRYCQKHAPRGQNYIYDGQNWVKAPQSWVDRVYPATAG